MRYLSLLILSYPLLSSPLADAGSAARFAMPPQFGESQAGAYDDAGRRIGNASLAMAKTAAGGVAVTIDVRLNSGASAVMLARLRPLPGGNALRLSRERTWAFDAQGELVVSMRADHDAGSAQCTYRDQGTQSVRLADGERIVNVPLNLLLRPLVAGEVERLGFQTLLCEEQARIIDAEVSRVGDIPVPGRARLVETRYRPDLGPLLSFAVAPFMQRISLWFEAQAPYRWVGHRMPLYAGGAAVLVLRSDFRPQDLAAGGL